MSDVIIKVEELGKLYRLGEIGTGTISHDLNRWWARVRGKQDPFAKIGETNDRTAKGASEYVWALKDVNFEVKQGEVLGIIGRNGAGKSTLLKLLSKVTAPSRGNIKVKGRIASLLEVGTGFHPELTGRENIYLNGAILGMTKEEIRRKFDEIVDFAGVERYIDTPVKRYSSGMYVRLAFSVAAFLEPEILIVDEVLAVGDAEFQKKCLGRMKDVSENDGRTVLFVSHDINAISTLCTKGLYLKNGLLAEAGELYHVISSYLNNNINTLRFINNVKEITKPELLNIIIDEEGLKKGNLILSAEFASTMTLRAPVLGITVKNVLGQIIFATNTRFNSSIGFPQSAEKGTFNLRIDKLPLHTGTYSISAFLGDSVNDYARYFDVLSFDFINPFIESTQIPSIRDIGSVFIENATWHFES